MKALVVNDLAGETLQHYGMVLGIEEGEHEIEHNENMTSNEHSTDSSSNETSSIVDEPNYQTAQATITQAIQNFDEIKKIVAQIGLNGRFINAVRRHLMKLKQLSMIR